MGKVAYDSEKVKAEAKAGVTPHIITMENEAEKSKKSTKTKKPKAEKPAKKKTTKKEENEKAQKAALALLEKRQKWLISSDFVKSCPEIKNRSKARRILRILGKKNKVQILQHPKRKRRYIFGLLDWKPPTKNNFNAKK